MQVVDNHILASAIVKDGIATAILQGNRIMADMSIAPQGKRCFDDAASVLSRRFPYNGIGELSSRKRQMLVIPNSLMLT